ncbi:formyl-CoA transferase [Oceanicola sp. 22II-s10i]|uniref:CaiB/BaiF CoA transferase family protein n=1 Tax=Oceanicola sp. 22II-s10i TaxID=1317116 RepID=UPI000B520B3D|nr:CoA transferase [Oceanicola sp. 22II-s10i]OWU84182.1 formyl-CoA transferase [Oceanicola sp. 22II-s10i]
MPPKHYSGALEGVVVLDLTMMLAGPFASMMLADQGATVIKIEPVGGDNTRRIGPHMEGEISREDGGYGGYFGSINRNKRSICIDFKTKEGVALFHDMVRQADAVIENYRGGVADRLGNSYEVLREVNPALVYASVRGFGDQRGGKSPYGHWPAYDPVAQSMGGIMAITGAERGAMPTKVGPGVGDIIPAMYAAFGLVSAVLRARATGEGQYVDIAMVDAIMATCERSIFQLSFTGNNPGVEGNHHPLFAPFGLFRAKDGWVTITAQSEKFWEILTRLIGRPELAADPRYLTGDLRGQHRDEVIAIVEEFTLPRTRAEIAEVLGGNVPFGPVYLAADQFTDPHFAARDMLVTYEHPGTGRQTTIANTPVKMTGTPGGVHSRAPLQGEHTDAILQEFGLSPERISELRASRVVE